MYFWMIQFVINLIKDFKSLKIKYKNWHDIKYLKWLVTIACWLQMAVSSCLVVSIWWQMIMSGSQIILLNSIVAKFVTRKLACFAYCVFLSANICESIHIHTWGVRVKAWGMVDLVLQFLQELFMYSLPQCRYMHINKFFDTLNNKPWG